MPKHRGLFISFEGTEGSGKSTLIKIVAKRLTQKSRPVILTREPGGTSVSEKIRKILLKDDMHPLTEILLYEASRAEHVQKVIMPALKKNHIVLCDRYTDSTLAYQAYARGLSWKMADSLNKIATDGLKPDFSVFLDLPPQIGLSRAKVFTRFEAEGLRFQKKVRQGFLKAIKNDPKRWIPISVKDKTPDEIADIVFKKIERRL